MIDIKKLEEEQIKLYDVLDELDKTWDFSKDYSEYAKMRKPYTDKLSKIDREIRFNMSYELNELPNFGDVMSLEEFIECVKDGGFIDYDGYGSYVKDGKETNITILPSDVKYNNIRKEFNTIIWYNR